MGQSFHSNVIFIAYPDSIKPILSRFYCFLSPMQRKASRNHSEHLVYITGVLIPNYTELSPLVPLSVPSESTLEDQHRHSPPTLT